MFGSACMDSKKKAQAKILLVENEKAWCEAMISLLNEYELHIAYTYPIALQKVRSFSSYDLLILNMNLLSMSEKMRRDRLGAKLLKHIQDIKLPCTCILITGDSDISVRQWLRQFNIADIFIKGHFSLDRFLDTVEMEVNKSMSKKIDYNSHRKKFSHGYALLVGVGSYNENRLSVPVTAQDAEDFDQILTNPELCAYPENQVVSLTNENANKKRILSELDTLKGKAEEDGNSTVLIFFSGHGWHQDEYYFLPYETETFIDSGRLQIKLDTVLANQEFLDKVRQIPAQRIVILFNTCFAGGTGTALSAEIEDSSQFAPVPLDFYDKILLEGTGRVIISSSQTNEKSWIKGGGKNSLFVTHLLSAFQGKGMNNEEGIVGILDVFTYISREVPNDAKSIGCIQTPVLKAYDLTQNFPVGLFTHGKSLSSDQHQTASIKSSFKIHLDIKILKALYSYYKENPGSPRMTFIDLAETIAVSLDDADWKTKVLPTLFTLQSKGWISYESLADASNGLVQIEPNGMKMADFSGRLG